ncbi:D(2) dopamine receptor [Elysia marginata]|uniref:D(2) dopamine receptor n=1 Tax=Elysia marginata TaxID=1093978 RepID=A0AAV4FK13_9GAST|nr:D(2) dopamine receptor [Elysia marginata]
MFFLCPGTSTNINKGTMKSIKFFLTVFGVFLVCGTPTVVVMGLDYHYSVPSTVYRFLTIIAVSNSGMNFIIYAAMNRQFRHAFLMNSALARCRNSPACCCLHSWKDGEGEGHADHLDRSDLKVSPQTVSSKWDDKKNKN